MQNFCEKGVKVLAQGVMDVELGAQLGAEPLRETPERNGFNIGFWSAYGTGRNR